MKYIIKAESDDLRTERGFDDLESAIKEYNKMIQEGYYTSIVKEGF